MVRVLAVSDVVDEGLLADLSPVHGTELIFACGDLPFEYLGYLMKALDVPLMFVRNVTGRRLLDIDPGVGLLDDSPVGQRRAR